MCRFWKKALVQWHKYFSIYRKYVDWCFLALHLSLSQLNLTDHSFSTLVISYWWALSSLQQFLQLAPKRKITIFFFCSCETHVKFLLFLSPKKLISFGVGIAILLYWQWQPTSLPLISPVVHARVIKENTKLDLSLKNSSSQAPCCLKFFPLVLLVAVFSLRSCLLTGFLNWHLVSAGNALLKSTYVRLTEFLLSKM